jgi:hypothetical protein
MTSQNLAHSSANLGNGATNQRKRIRTGELQPRESGVQERSVQSPVTLPQQQQTLTHSLMEQGPSWEAGNCAATQELPSIYGIRRFITVFTRALHWSLSWAQWRCQNGNSKLSNSEFKTSHHSNVVFPLVTWPSYFSTCANVSSAYFKDVKTNIPLGPANKLEHRCFHLVSWEGQQKAGRIKMRHDLHADFSRILKLLRIRPSYLIRFGMNLWKSQPIYTFGMISYLKDQHFMPSTFTGQNNIEKKYEHIVMP